MTAFTRAELPVTGEGDGVELRPLPLEGQRPGRLRPAPPPVTSPPVLRHLRGEDEAGS